VLIIPGSLGTSLFVEGSHGEGLKNSVIVLDGQVLPMLVPAVLALCLFGGQTPWVAEGGYLDAFNLKRVWHYPASR
jgi:hypothetical protein